MMSPWSIGSHVWTKWPNAQTIAVLQWSVGTYRII